MNVVTSRYAMCFFPMSTLGLRRGVFTRDSEDLDLLQLQHRGWIVHEELTGEMMRREFLALRSVGDSWCWSILVRGGDHHNELKRPFPLTHCHDSLLGNSWRLRASSDEELRLGCRRFSMSYSIQGGLFHRSTDDYDTYYCLAPAVAHSPLWQFNNPDRIVMNNRLNVHKMYVACSQ